MVLVIIFPQIMKKRVWDSSQQIKFIGQAIGRRLIDLWKGYSFSMNLFFFSSFIHLLPF